jgi:rhodanese-related sulfurtransferase
MSTAQPSSGAIAFVTAQQAAELQGGAPAALIVDVRERHEYEELRAPHVALLPLSEFEARYLELPRDRQLLMICRSGGRSLRAATFLAHEGFAQVANVDGGMIAWKGAGLAVRSGPPAPGEGALPATDGPPEPASGEAAPWRAADAPRHPADLP